MRTILEGGSVGRAGLIILAVTALFWMGAGTALAGQSVEIKDPALIADLSALSAEMDGIANAVTSCMQDGKGNMDCMCENRDKISHFNRTAKGLFAKYPDLDKKGLVYYQASNNKTDNLNLPAIKRQAEMKLQCKE